MTDSTDSPRVRFATRRRLIVAFAAVLAVSMLAPGYSLFALNRMEDTFAAMVQQEQSTHLALQIEDAVHEQYEHGALFMRDGDPAHLASVEATRARALELTRALTGRMSEAEAVSWQMQIDEGTSQLAKLFRTEAALPHPAAELPPRTGNGTVTTLANDPSYAVVLLIEKSIHEYFGNLQQATSEFRANLVATHHAMLQWTAVLLLVSAAFAFATVLYVSTSVARPLAQLSEGAAAVAGGDLSTRIRVDSPDEFGALAAEFNAMTVALAKQQRRTIEAEKLAGIGRVAAGIAHELNNPLQVVLGYLALNRDIEDATVAEQLAAAEAEALRCKDIVDGMLELSRPEHHSSAHVNLRDICDDVSSSLRVTAPARSSTDLSVAGSAVAVGDRTRIRQILFNLVKNALEAAGPQGRVSIEIAASTDGSEVIVRDSGAGIAPELRARIFEPFFTTKPEGTGLGLAVSRAIARAHGGDIDVRNADPAGAVFTLRLPRAAEVGS